MRLFKNINKKKETLRGGGATPLANDSQGVKFAYLHIGKTGGTSISNIAQKAKEAGYEVPQKLGHDTKLSTAARTFPNAEFSFTIRDPISRMISAFDSRLRQSRPTYTALWKSDEAICYLWFPTSLDFFEALLSSDERQKSAGLFAKHHLGHVRRGYEFHFESPEVLRALEERIYYVGQLEDGINGQAGYFGAMGVPETFVKQNGIHAHSGGSSTKTALAKIPDKMLNELKDYFHTEYEIYAELKRLATKYS